MEYYQLVYKSIAVPNLSEEKVIDILKKSQQKNLSKKVSGLLVYHNEHFIQFIEGEKDIVIELFEKISQDSRHHTIELLNGTGCESLIMPTWAMAYFSNSVGEDKQLDNRFVLNKKTTKLIFNTFPQHIKYLFLEILKDE